MSTEATGDGKPDAVDAVEPDAGLAGAEPTATAVAEPAADFPRQASELGGASAAGEAADADEGADAGGIAEVGGTTDVGEAADAGGGLGAGEVPEGAEANAADAGVESDEDYEEYEDYDVYESGEDDEVLEYDEDYEGDESDEITEPRRARRWPRVLLGLGFVILAAAIVGGAIAIVGSVTHGFKKPVKVTYKKSAVFSLKTEDCFDPQGQSYTLISCASPHQAEVFATFTLTGTKWPGATAVQARASGGCASRLTGYLNPQLAISLASTYVYPDSVAWQAGTRTVICEVRATSGELTGSVRGASASAS
jgi:hypothetical protein